MNCLYISLAALGLAVPLPESPEPPRTKPQRVHQLFEQMRAGKYRSLSLDFPSLQWEDIPDLLEMGKSARVLKTFPRNLLSSQMQTECSEGMVALWLVEGLRQGGRFASLNALCLPEGPVKGEWGKISQANHPRVLKAYQEWWKQVQSRPPDKARQVDPLQGSKLHWH